MLSNSVLNLLKKASEAEVIVLDLQLSDIKVVFRVYTESEDEQQFDTKCSQEMERSVLV